MVPDQSERGMEPCYPLLEVCILERDEAAFLDLEAADDVLRVDVLAGVAAHLVVADRLQVALVQEVEAELLRRGRGEHAHRHTDEAERDRAAPDWTGHEAPCTRVRRG